MSSVDHLHVEPKMLKVREHSELLSAQYWLDVWNQEISATPSPQGKRLRDGWRRHYSPDIVEPMMLANNRKTTLPAIQSDAVNKAVKDQKKNIVLDGLPHPINDSE